MKLILYSWNANNEQVLADNLIHMGFEIAWFRKKCRHYTRDMELAMEMIPYIHAQKAEAVLSFNYFPVISMICSTCQIPYYAWVYDCPHFTLYARQIFMPCNHIGVFDREMGEYLKAYGVETVYHVPLATDTEYFEDRIQQASKEKRQKYASDVSFVGSLYTGEYDYYDHFFEEEKKHRKNQGGESEHECGMIDTRHALFKYDALMTREYKEKIQLNQDLIVKKMRENGLLLGEDYFAKEEDIFIPAVWEKKITVDERRILLTEISRMRKIKFKLYTGSDVAKVSELNACACGSVDYHTEMPLVFAESKINLNITLRSIHSGIPLRVLDIMACGGFVLTNWQPEIEEYFAEDEEIVTFRSMEECLNKITYYLSHDEERIRIAAAGQKKVREIFSYQAGLARLFQV